jgi:hypothetical protein
MKAVSVKSNTIQTSRFKMRLLLKLALLPWVRSPFLQLLLCVALGQLFLGVWLGGSIDREVSRTEQFASRARWVTVQEKPAPDAPASPSSGILAVVQELVKNLPSPPDVEEVQTDTVLKQMESEEAEVVEILKSMGKEGFSLIPRVVLIRGEVPDQVLEKLRKHPEVARVDVSPVHHARLLGFYKHIQLEMRFALGMILFLMAVMVLAVQRIQWRDLREVKENLRTFGAGSWTARMPLWVSLIGMVIFAAGISLIEWAYIHPGLFQKNTFLGELSIDRSMTFPWSHAFSTAGVMLLVVTTLSFAGRDLEE